MSEIFKCLGFDNEKITNEDVLEFIGKNNIKVKGLYSTYFNAYSRNSNANIQFSRRWTNKDGFDNGFCYHHTNNCVWNFKINKDSIHTEIEEKAEKYFTVSSNLKRNRNNDEDIAIKIVNSDVLPSCRANDIVKAQVSAFAQNVYLYSKPEPIVNGKKHFEDKDVEKTAFIETNSSYNYIKDYEEYSNYSLIYGKVTEMREYKEELFGQSISYFGVKVDTKFGPIKIYFGYNNILNIDKDVLENDSIEKGVYILCLAIISADVYLTIESLINEPNEENNNRIFRKALETKRADLLNAYLDNKCIYKSCKWDIVGKDKIIKKLLELESKSFNITLDLVTIYDVNKHLVDNNDLKIGDICYCLLEDCNNHHRLCYIKTGKNNKINKIIITDTTGYSFSKLVLPDYLNEKYEENRKDDKYSNLSDKKIYEVTVNKLLFEYECNIKKSNSNVGFPRCIDFILFDLNIYDKINEYFDKTIADDYTKFILSDYFLAKKRNEEYKVKLYKLYLDLNESNTDNQMLLDAKRYLFKLLDTYVLLINTNIKYYDMLKKDNNGELKNQKEALNNDIINLKKGVFVSYALYKESMI